MAVPVVESAAARTSGDTAGTCILAKPSGVVAGDLLLAFIVNGAINSGSLSSSGWTILDSRILLIVGNSQFVWAYKVAGGSEPSSYTFTSSYAPGYWHGAIVRISGAATPVYGGETVTTTASVNIPHPSMTTPSADCLVVLGPFNQNSSTDVITPPAGFTSHQQNGNASYPGRIGIFSQGQASAGATGAVNSTVASSNRKAGVVLAVPSSAPPAAPAGGLLAFT